MWKIKILKLLKDKKVKKFNEYLWCWQLVYWLIAVFMQIKWKLIECKRRKEKIKMFVFFLPQLVKENKKCEGVKISVFWNIKEIYFFENTRKKKSRSEKDLYNSWKIKKKYV